MEFKRLLTLILLIAGTSFITSCSSTKSGEWVQFYEMNGNGDQVSESIENPGGDIKVEYTIDGKVGFFFVESIINPNKGGTYKENPKVEIVKEELWEATEPRTGAAILPEWDQEKFYFTISTVDENKYTAKFFKKE